MNFLIRTSSPRINEQKFSWKKTLYLKVGVSFGLQRSRRSCRPAETTCFHAVNTSLSLSKSVMFILYVHEGYIIKKTNFPLVFTI